MWFHLRRKTTGRLALELWPEIRRTVLVAGSGRSGTTWLAQMLNYDNRFRVLFEPFRPDGGHGVPALPAYIYLRKNEENSEVFKLVSNILLGRIHSPWIDQYNVRFFSLRRLVKDIHLNLLLGWMQNKFPDLKIVWILRHPFAVALSKTIAHQKNGSWAPAIHRFLENDAFRDGVLQPFLSELTDFPKMDIWGQHVWRWSIENYVPLVQLKKDKICTVHYEHLCQNPNKELTRIFDYLDMTIPKGIEKSFNRPSPLARETSAICLKQDLVESWLDRVNKEQVYDGVSILKKFGLEKLYDQYPMPHVLNSA